MPILNPPSVQIVTSDLQRRQLQVSAPPVAAGESALLEFQMGISVFFQVSCANLLRLRLYASAGARAADLPRAIAAPPPRGRGLLLEVVSTEVLRDFELAPVAWSTNTSGVFATVTNLEAQLASSTFTIHYWEF